MADGHPRAVGVGASVTWAAHPAMSLDVRTWLRAGGFSEYADLFEANEIDGEALLALTDGHLRELGIALGHRAKLLKAIAQLSPPSPPISAGPSGRSFGRGAAGGEPDTIAAERRHLTVMFVDLVGSCHSPERRPTH